jgi:hypothetical protein
VCQLLIKSGANPNEKDAKDLTPMEVAAVEGHKMAQSGGDGGICIIS